METRNKRTASEQGLFDVGLTELSDLMVHTRTGYIVSDPALLEHGYHGFFSVAHQINLPLLFLSADIIRRLHPNQWIGYLGRDCFLLEQIYRHYFSFTCAYIPFSRVVAVRDRDLAVEYLNSFGCDVLVDISSTGKTWEFLGAKQSFNVRVLIYSDTTGYTHSKPIPPASFRWVARNSQIGGTCDVIELFNTADSGMILNLSPIEYAAHEIPDYQLPGFHDPVARAIKHAARYPKLTAQLAALSDEQVASYFEKYLMTLNDQKAILNWIPHYQEKNGGVTVLLNHIFEEIKNISSEKGNSRYSVG